MNGTVEERCPTGVRIASRFRRSDTGVRTTRGEAARRRTPCLRRLTATQREAVRLTYYTGYTQRQAADLLEVPLTTIKGRLRDGLIKLCDCLGMSV